MYYKYDLEGVDLEDCDKLIVIPVNVDAIPAIMGTLEALSWRARHVSDASFEIGKQMYQEIMEVFTVNDCITGALDDIKSALLSLLCICEQSQTTQQQNDQILSETIYKDLEGNPDVSFTGTEETNYDYGDVPQEYDSERCRRAQAVFYNIADVMDRVVGLQLGVSGIASGAMAGLLASFLTVSIPVSIVIGLIVGIAYVFVEDAIKQGLQEWRSLQSTAICILYNSTDMATASQALKVLADDKITNTAANTYIKLFYGTVLMGQMWQYSDNWEDFDPGACSDCNPPDPRCAVLDCVVEHWSIHEEGELGCSGGVPYAVNAFPIRWVGDAPTQPTASFRLEVDWTAQGDSGTGILGVKLRDRVTDADILVHPPAEQPVGSRTVSTWDLFFPAGVDHVLDLETAQATWYGLVHGYCLRPL